MSSPYTTTYNKQDIKETLTATLESDFKDKGDGKVVSNVYLDKETVTDKYDTNTDLLDDSLIDLTFTFPPLEELSKIDIDEFTRNVSMNPVDFTVIGDGIFDNLMETACTHLTAQFESGRIHGEEYASAYVDIYKATLQVIANTWTAKAQASAQAALAISQAHLAKAQALKAYIEAKYALPLSRAQLYYVQRQGDVQRAQAQLLSGQLNKLATDMKLTEAQIETEKKKALNVAAQTSLIDAQTTTEQKKPANVEAQTSHINAQTELTEAQTTTEEKKALNVVAQTGLIEAQTETEEKKPAQVQAQIDLTNAQKTTEDKKPANVQAQTDLINAQEETEEKKAANIQAQTNLVSAQKLTEDKKPANVQAQTDLINEQKDTEISRQTLMTKQGALCDAQAANQTAQTATEAMKSKLYARQIEGFNENFKEKLLKIMIDGYTVLFSVAKDSFINQVPTPLGESAINSLWTSINSDIDAGDNHVGPPSNL